MRDERGLTPCTISQWRSRAATFLRWCFNTGRRFSTLSPEDIDAYFITYGAQRWSRISAGLDQIDWAAGQLHIWRLKRRQPQVYPLAFTVAEALAQYVDTVRPKVLHPEIFIRTRAPLIPISTAGLYNIVLNIQAAHLGPHALRHACAARLLANGLSLKEIGDHLGHRSTSATMTYTKVDLVSLREVGDFDLGDLL
jgi:integrase